MSHSFRGEAKRTQAAKGSAMGVKNEWLPGKAASIAGSASEKVVPYPASIAAPQFPDTDGYKNDGGVPQSWVTGSGENATNKPGYDKGGSK